MDILLDDDSPSLGRVEATGDTPDSSAKKADQSEIAGTDGPVVDNGAGSRPLSKGALASRRGKERFMAKTVSPAEAVAHWMAAHIPQNLRGNSRDPVEIINHAREELIRRQQSKKGTPQPDHPRR